MKLRTVAATAFTLLGAFAPGAFGTPVYDLWNRNDSDSQLMGLEGWGLRIERLFGQGVRDFSIGGPGGARLYVAPASGQAHLLAQFAASNASGSGAGPYTLNLMFGGMTLGAGGSSLAAGHGAGGAVVLGTLTTPGGGVYHVVTDAGSGASLTLSSTANGLALELDGSLRFCADASCETLVTGAMGTLALSAACAEGSDCTGFPVAGESAGGTGNQGAGTGQIFSLALPPEGPAAAADIGNNPEVPEPSTYVMAGAGLLALAFSKRRC